MGHRLIAHFRSDDLRPLLQRAGFALTTSTHLRVYIPKVEDAELKLLKSEAHGQYIGIAFDGTTRLGRSAVKQSVPRRVGVRAHQTFISSRY